MIQNTTLSWPRIFAYCLVLFIVSRLFFVALAFAVHNDITSSMPYSAVFTLLDGVWYSDIAQHGYDAHTRGSEYFGHQNYVFFPLYPLLIKGVMLLSGLKAMVAGQIVSHLCFFTSLCLFYAFMARKWGEETAQISALLLVFSPYNIYFMSVYTESLFFLLSLLFWMAAQNKRWFWMGVCGFLMGLTHPNGVFCFILALWFVWDDYKQGGQLIRYWPILLIPMSMIAYMIYMHFHVGDALAFVHNEQKAWHRDGWLHFGKVSRIQRRQTTGDAYNVSIYLLALALSVYLWVKGCRKEAWFIPVFTVMGLLSGTFVGLARYSAALFQFYIALGLFAREKKGVKIFLTAEVVSSILLMFCWIEQTIPAF